VRSGTTGWGSDLRIVFGETAKPIKLRRENGQGGSVIYNEVLKRGRKEIELLLSIGRKSDIQDGLLSAAYYDPDWRWVQGKCLDYLNHADPDIRYIAATCLGYLARIHRQLDIELVLPKLHELRADPLVAAGVNDSLDDIKFFLKFQ
jgi:hypothetical protein